MGSGLSPWRPIQTCVDGPSGFQWATMVNLTPEQLAELTAWAEAGATLNDVQQRLKQQFGITMTYLDARLLLLDLQVKIKEKPKDKPPEPVVAETLPPEDDGFDSQADDLSALPVAPPVGTVPKLSVDQVTMPAALVSGKVTFTDGQTISWYVDQMGRLGLRGQEPGYQPPPQDVPLFQQELDRILTQAGF
jgi:hypothetical protein